MLFLQPQNVNWTTIPSTSTAQEKTESRRMSEPCPPPTHSPPAPPRPRSAHPPSPHPTPLHPNQEVTLDQMAEGELLENKLVLPDDMVIYLNHLQVGSKELICFQIITSASLWKQVFFTSKKRSDKVGIKQTESSYKGFYRIVFQLVYISLKKFFRLKYSTFSSFFL